MSLLEAEVYSADAISAHRGVCFLSATVVSHIKNRPPVWSLVSLYLQDLLTRSVLSVDTHLLSPSALTISLAQSAPATRLSISSSSALLPARSLLDSHAMPCHAMPCQVPVFLHDICIWYLRSSSHLPSSHHPAYSCCLGKLAALPFLVKDQTIRQSPSPGSR
ncbi:hypothetical protein B0O99DRAFT_331753 [Bisporella sp. PMI_857]|nr:hypothetical protein B0O99DRAFT_331753 [Bisporella sp. PMI_857]